jgi:hypothetical protein
METNEVIDREMTNAEFDIHEKELAEKEALKAQEIAKVQAKADLLERLGITAEEALLLQ